MLVHVFEHGHAVAQVDAIDGGGLLNLAARTVAHGLDDGGPVIIEEDDAQDDQDEGYDADEGEEELGADTEENFDEGGFTVRFGDVLHGLLEGSILADEGIALIEALEKDYHRDYAPSQSQGAQYVRYRRHLGEIGGRVRKGQDRDGEYVDHDGRAEDPEQGAEEPVRPAEGAQPVA